MTHSHGEDHHNHHDHNHDDHHDGEHDHHDHQGGHGHGHHGDFKKIFLISLPFALFIILFWPMMGVDFPFTMSFPGSNWLVLVSATFLFFYGGKPFLEHAVHELKDKKPAMMTLVSLGISVSYFYSVYAFFSNHFGRPKEELMDFFWELATLILVMLLGHWIENNAVGEASNALQKMAELLPSEATRINDDDSTEVVQLTDIQEGDIVRVSAGDNIPTDGVIISGHTSVDESLVTGESKQVDKSVNDKVIGGSVNGSGTIQVEVTGTGESGYLSQVMDLVGQAQKDQSRAELLSDKVAGWLFYFALIVGIITFIVWYWYITDIDDALIRLVSVLVIACPHALGLAIPLVAARSTSLGAQNGLIVKNREVMETAKDVDILLMDKTGTLTEGSFAVNHYQSFTDQYTNDQVLGFLAAIEESSTHPLAIGILEKAEEQSIDYPTAEEVNNLPGIGIEAMIDGREMKVVSVSYLDDNDIAYDQEQFVDLASEGNSVSFLIIDGENAGVVAQGDQIKPNARQLIDELKSRNIEPVMLTGDNKQVAKAVAEELGISTVHAQMMPEDKEEMVRNYRNQGKTVMMVGDGINDAPSLVRSDIGVAIGAGTDVAVESADVILVKSDPVDIMHFLTLSDNTMRKQIQNLWWGAGYNIIAVPLAAGVLAPWGILLPPTVAGIIMSFSTIIVALNAISLKLE